LFFLHARQISGPLKVQCTVAAEHIALTATANVLAKHVNWCCATFVVPGLWRRGLQACAPDITAQKLMISRIDPTINLVPTHEQKPWGA
jgi:hypothetical protein